MRQLNELGDEVLFGHWGQMAAWHPSHLPTAGLPPSPSPRSSRPAGNGEVGPAGSSEWERICSVIDFQMTRPNGTGEGGRAGAGGRGWAGPRHSCLSVAAGEGSVAQQPAACFICCSTLLSRSSSSLPARLAPPPRPPARCPHRPVSVQERAARVQGDAARHCCLRPCDPSSSRDR